MVKSDPIIAVKDVELSSSFYQSLLECNSIHGGDEFDVLESVGNEVILCLHKWGAHEHPTMVDPNIKPGNGLILYFRTDRLTSIRANATKLDAEIVNDIHLNPNSHKKEFSLLDGYFIIISEYHQYRG